MHLFAIVSVLFTAAVGMFANPVAERQSSQSVAPILIDIDNTVTPLANQMRECMRSSFLCADGPVYATPENATQATLTPIIDDISTVLKGAVTNLNKLSGQSTHAIMASADGATILSEPDIAGILPGVLIFKAASAVLAVVDEAVVSITTELLTTLGQV